MSSKDSSGPPPSPSADDYIVIRKPDPLTTRVLRDLEAKISSQEEELKELDELCKKTPNTGGDKSRSGPEQRRKDLMDDLSENLRRYGMWSPWTVIALLLLIGK